MRPIRLQMAGFSAFRDLAEISFEGADLAAFVGPTGSGKSSVIDAIAFALYGSVARYDDLRLVEPVIHKLCPEAKVRLDFELNDQRYTAVRVVRRTASGATTKEARLVRSLSDGSEEILAGSQREMGPAIVQLLGLEFEQFTRTVVLPQGDFAAFLHEGKKERQQLLRQLLEATVYEQMGKAARNRANVARAKADVLLEQREAIGVVTDEQLSALTSRVEALISLQATVASDLEAVGKLDAEINASASQLEQAGRLVAALAAVSMPPAVTELAPHLTEAELAVSAASDRLAAARTKRDEAQHACDDGPDVVVLERALNALEALQRSDAAIAELTPEVEAAQAAASLVDEALAGAALVLEEAEDALRAAKEAAGLGAVIASLVVGEPCPVCAQEVTSLPAHDVDAELTRAKTSHKAAKDHHAQAAADASVRAKTSDQLAARLESLSEDRLRVMEVVPADTDAAALREQLEAAAAAKETFDAALKEVVAAERAADEAQRVQDQLLTQEVALRRQLLATRDSVAECAPPAVEGASLEDDWADLVRWAGDERLRRERVLQDASDGLTALRSERTERATGLEAACASAGVKAPLARLGEGVATALSQAQHAVAAADAQRTRHVELTNEIRSLETDAALDREMGQLLSASGFERWLLQTALDDLVARATDRLLELSSGQYSLESDDGDFWIRDHRNADERRSVRTLSGGETFLASLALALALAENISELAVEGGPRIESMFLDEGFGTLDPDTLDIVAAAIEELSSSGRLIGIVTHIRELADRMPVRFEVHKDARTARVERVEV